MSKYFTRLDSINSYDLPVMLYTAHDQKIVIEAQGSASGTYNWIKIRHPYGLGNDKSMNLSMEWLKTIDLIRKDIEKVNKKSAAR